MIRREAKHQTMASMRYEAVQAEYDFPVGTRVMTCDRIPGKVAAVYDGPIRGTEEYFVELDNDLGQGRYTASQLEKESTPVESSLHTADVDYPELKDIIRERPDPARMEYTASKKTSEFVPGLNLEAEPPDYQSTVQPGLRIEDIPPEKQAENLFIDTAKVAFTKAAVDQDFRFQFTSAWKDIVNKAKRIRSEGGVNITHAADGVIFGNVQGDTRVYETGIERLPNTKTGVSSWSCGCAWGAYHWGAEDDLSRFAGRQCSHSLALQYEAQSKGMFGKTIDIDNPKPKWVPSRVVVKYDIDSGRHITTQSSLELSPASIIVSLANEKVPGLAEELYAIASVYDPFGDSPKPNVDISPNVPGATTQHDPLDNPGSSGYATGADPANWGSIQDNDTFSRHMSSATPPDTTSEINPSEMGGNGMGANTQGADSDKDPHVLASKDEPGSEAELKDEPEAALPETTAKDYTYEHPDILSPNNPGSEQPSATNVGLVTGDPERGGVNSGQDSQTQQTEIDDVLRDFQRSASHLAPGGIQIEALKDFSFQEQQELINEGKGSRTRNFDKLSIEGTHYAYIEDEDGDDSWLS